MNATVKDVMTTEVVAVRRETTFKELAAQTGLSVNTLLSRKHYAVLYLRKRLQSIYDEFTKG